MGKKFLAERKAGKLFAALLASASALAMFSNTPADARQTAQAVNTPVSFDIAEQPLSSALSEFARQSGVRVLYPYDQLNQIRAPALHGRYSREEALRMLLAQSGYVASIDGTSVRLEPVARPQAASAEQQRDDIVETANASNAQGPTPADAADAESNADAVVVTGTRIRGAAPAGAHVLVINRDQIDRSGRTSVQDVVQNLPQNFAGSQNEATQQGTLNARSNFTFGSSLDLRGLGADATLALVNGRRLALAGSGNFVDVSTIPLSAVDRIEVLADGASATYGADAVGGVVNIILKKNFAGAETELHYGGATQGGAEEFGASQLAGFNWSSGHLTVGYDHRGQGGIDIAQRDFSASANFTSRGGTNFNRVNSNPGNIIRIGTATTSLAIPHNQDGTHLTQAALISGAPNLGEIHQGSWLLPRQESNSLFLSATQDLGANIELFADLIASDRQAFALRENLAANLTVPETNAYRVLDHLFPGQGALTVAYHLNDDLGPITNSTETRMLSGVAGGALSLANDWRIEASVALAKSTESIALDNFFDSATIVQPLASGNLATAFNPFADGSNTNPAVLAGLSFDQHAQTRSRIVNYALKADGPLWPIWGGVMRAAFGVERREEEFRYVRTETHVSGTNISPTQAPGSRTVDAFYAELNAPLVHEDNHVPLVRALDLSLSARREQASDYGSDTTPKIGLSWEVVDGFGFRASWGRSFKGPTFAQLLGGVGLSYLTATAAQDPLATNGATGVLAVSGANAKLHPERATSWTAGFELAPVWARGVRASASYFDIDFSDRVSTPTSPLTILANPTGYESIVFRNPSPQLIAKYLTLGTPTGVLPAEGVEVIIDRRNVNLADQRVRGLDFDASYVLHAPIGEISLNAALTFLLEHEMTIVQGALPVVALNTLNNPIDLRARTGAAWRRGVWSAGVSVNYADNYTDNVSIPARPIASFTTYDARIAADWGGEDGKAAQIALSVQNLFDADPPFVNNSTGFGYDASNASPLGRVAMLTLRRRW